MTDHSSGRIWIDLYSDGGTGLAFIMMEGFEMAFPGIDLVFPENLSLGRWHMPIPALGRHSQRISESSRPAWTTQ